MSDPKRATLITVGATKSEKNKVNKTVRLTINLVESNESKYPELNYKELVNAEDRRKRTNIENGKNGKTNDGLNPFSDNDDDVERVARKFEQKYGGKSTYGRKGRSKTDDFADIGAGYDENDSFIDNTDGYDEMIPPECDTLYGGFYINSGSLEFKNVDPPPSDDEPRGRRNKRRISSSSSSEESSSSSSGSEGSNDEKEANTANGDIHSPHRKKKNKNIDKKKAKKIQRTDSSAPTSGKQTSDDNVHGDGESADSRTSQSDSLTSKPAPSSENPVTSDSSRDVEAKVEKEMKLPPQLNSILEELETFISRHPEKLSTEHKDVQPIIIRLHVSLASLGVDKRVHSAAWTRAARALRVSRTKLLQAGRALAAHPPAPPAAVPPPPAAAPAGPPPLNNKRKATPDLDDEDFSTLTEQEREAKIVETLKMLKALIDDRKPGMMANYKAECDRVQEERKKIQLASSDVCGGSGGEPATRRMPKRRFPWCAAARALLGRLARLAGGGSGAALLLHRRALPLFPAGFVRMPTLLRQADLSKELKHDSKRARSNSQPPAPAAPSPPPHFPSALTVTVHTAPPPPPPVAPADPAPAPAPATATAPTPATAAATAAAPLPHPRKDHDEEKREDSYIPPNNIGSITITPVTQKTEKKSSNLSSEKLKSESLIRVKSPAALNEMIHRQEKNKALENIHKRDKDKHRKERHHNHLTDKTNKEKRVDSPLHIDTSCQNTQKEPTQSPKTKDKIPQRQIESMRVAEGNIPRPALIPVHHSPTFAKPDKRPPEKKKKDLLIVSDVDPLGDLQTESVVAVDDSSSDVELVEDKSEKSDTSAIESVPSKDKVSVREVIKDGSSKSGDKRTEDMDEATKEDFDSVMKNLRDLEHSREAPKFKSSSYGGVITSAIKTHDKKTQQKFDPRHAGVKMPMKLKNYPNTHQHKTKRDKSSGRSLHSRSGLLAEPRSDADKLTNFFEQNGWL